MSKTPNAVLMPLIYIILAIISVQGGAAIAKTTFPVLGAATTASIRIGLAAVLLFLIHRTDLRKLTTPQWRAVVPFGLCVGGMNFVFYLAIERIPLGLGVTLEFIGPLLLAVFKSRRLTDYIWVAFAAAGILLIAPWEEGSIDPMGAFLALVAGGFWVGYITFGRQVTKVMDSGHAITVGMLFAGALVIPFGIVSGGFGNFSTAMIIPSCALAVFSSAIPFLLEMKALKQLPARTFSILMSLEPAVAAFSGMIFLGENLNFTEWMAILLVISASAGATLSTLRNSATDK